MHKKKLNYNELRKYLTVKYPGYKENNDVIARVHLIDKYKNEYIIFEFNQDWGYAIVKYNIESSQKYCIIRYTIRKLIENEVEIIENSSYIGKKIINIIHNKII